jgi:riboflavin biosynthesis pyrimidine reductase
MQGPVDAVSALPTTAAGLHPLYGDPPDGVRTNMVLSLDGATAFDGATRPLSDDTDLWLLNHLRGYADVLVVGAGTVRAEGYGPVRLDAEQREYRTHHGYAEDPPLAIVSARADLDRGLPVFGGDGPRPLLVTGERSRQQAERLADVADVVIAGDEQVDPGRLVAALRERGLRRILCEGGPSLLETFIAHDLVEDYCLSLAPRLAGGHPGGPAGALARPKTLALRHDGMLYLRYLRESGKAID